MLARWQHAAGVDGAELCAPVLLRRRPELPAVGDGTVIEAVAVTGGLVVQVCVALPVGMLIGCQVRSRQP